MGDGPDVSVVIAAKNEARYVAEAVNSILSQTGVAHELVFIDDGSDDATLEIVSKIAGRDANLKILRNPRKGKVSAFNYGVSQARGSWVCIFAGDDIMPAGSLAERWRAVKDVSSPKPVVGLCRLVTMSDIKSQNSVVVPKNPSRGGLTGVSYLMDRHALARCSQCRRFCPTKIPGWNSRCCIPISNWFTAASSAASGASMPATASTC